MENYNSSINIGSDNKNESSKNTDNTINLDKTAIGSKNTVLGDNNKVSINENPNVNHYKGFRKNLGIIPIVSPVVIRKLGRKNTRIVATVSFIISVTSGLITIISWMSSLNFSDTSSFHKFVLAYFSLLFPLFLYSSIILFALYYLFIRIYRYHSNTTCEECKKEFAYEELEEPDIEEIKTADGFIRTTKRHYTCAFCGDKITKTRKREILNDENKNSFFK